MSFPEILRLFVKIFPKGLLIRRSKGKKGKITGIPNNSFLERSVVT